jgi:hypothetical protein
LDFDYVTHLDIDMDIVLSDIGIEKVKVEFGSAVVAVAVLADMHTDFRRMVYYQSVSDCLSVLLE